MNDCINSLQVNTKGYSIDWNDIIRPAVLKRDGYRCKHCSLSNRISYAIENNTRVILDDKWLLARYQSLNFKIYKVAISIAHTCHNKACSNELHLIALCQSCHLRFDKHIHVLNRLKNAANKRKA